MTPQGTSVASFGLAVNRRYRQGEEQREEVCFVDIVCFGRQAETASEYLSKGNLVMIEGRLQWRTKRAKRSALCGDATRHPRPPVFCPSQLAHDGRRGAGVRMGRH